MSAPTEDEWREAQARFHNAVSDFSDVLERWALGLVAEAYPAAFDLEALGEYGENGLTLRAQRVRDEHDRVVGGWLPGADTDCIDGFRWDDLTDEVDPLLDWLADLTGDFYLGEHTFEVHPHGLT